MDEMKIFQLLTEGKIAIGMLIIAVLAIKKLYNDMRNDSTNRENRLIEHQKEQNQTMSEISNTLQRIDIRMEKMDGRICSLEDYWKDVKRGELRQ